MNINLNITFYERNKKYQASFNMTTYFTYQQSQLTELQQKMAARQSEARNLSDTLQELQHHKKHDEVEVCDFWLIQLEVI